LQDKPKEVGKLVQKKDAITGLLLKYYSGEVEFVQVVKLKAAVKTRLEGKIDYMACTDAQCLPLMQRRFTVSLQYRAKAYHIDICYEKPIIMFHFAREESSS